MRKLMLSLAVGALTLAPQTMAAEDAALIIVGGDYRRLTEVPGAADATELAQTLEDQGFVVTSSLDRAAEGVWQAVEAFRENAAEADRVLVFLSGHMVTSQRDSYLLTRFANRPSDLSVGGQSVPFGPILDTLGEHPGQAVLLLAPSGALVGGEGLAPGAAPDAPQGVTIVTGPPDALVEVATEVLLVPGLPPATAFADAPDDISVSGFLSDAVPFLSGPGGMPLVIEREIAPDMESAFWQVVAAMGQAEGYQAYLKAYPNGRYRTQAGDAIAAIEDDTEAQVMRDESALSLTRNARRAIQQHLSLLGYSTRGIDGIFGPGTRRAIAAWQQAEGYPATGYLDAPQYTALTAAGQVRAAQLEAEAEERRLAEERQDRAYWRGTGQAGDEAGLRAYLERYPDGLFAGVAEARLAEIEEAARAAAQAQERDAWDAARAADNVAAYEDYLARYPRGSFADAAKARLAELTVDDDDAAVIAAAKAEEARVAGNRVTRLLIETRLAARGFDPGNVDGTFKKATRRAIRQFQRNRGLTVTGYVTQQTMAHLMSAP